ncbi:hypothetical protein SLS56_006950 [Neofusicoccum ribis]|uniref:Cytochrome P450 n=1 Tax=Neofusicoccum ribis TaxID=45134 RepID=A0ABR3SPU6_9PEZI
MEATTSQQAFRFGPYVALSGLFFTLAAYLIHRVLQIGTRPASLPPGPPTRPIWGNIREIPAVHPHLQYTAWAARYGPLYSIMKGNTPYLIISSAPLAHELLNKRGQLTAGRPAHRLDLEGRGNYVPAMMSGPRWRAARKMWHSILNVGAARCYLPYQTLEASKLLVDVADDPTRLRRHLERFSNSVGMTMLNGLRVPSAEDPGIREVVDSLLEWGLLGMRWGWLDDYAFVWKLPYWAVPGRPMAKVLTARHEELVWRHWNKTKELVRTCTPLPNFIAAIQEKLKGGWEGISEREGCEVANSLLVAATDTTSSSLNNWVAAMALFPEVQRKAQEEIDRVVGPDRLPRDEDTIDLPYTRQVIQELQRWISVAPLALPHATTAPMQVGEWHIPAGTVLVLNTYAIHTDPTTYPEPREFRPERWEGKLEMVTSDEQVGARTDLFAFGAGRRVCPGQHLAERNLFFMVSYMLWAFDIKKQKDDAGREIDIDMDDLRPGIVNTINPYSVDVKPRSAGRLELVKANWAEQREKLLDANEQWIQSPEAVTSVMAKTAK